MLSTGNILNGKVDAGFSIVLNECFYLVNSQQSAQIIIKYDAKYSKA